MKRSILTAALVFLLAACAGPQASQPPGQPRAWFDMPLPETVISDQGTCQIIAHGASGQGIALFEFLLNGAPASSITSPDTAQTLVTLTTGCPELAPGRNSIELRVKDTSGAWSHFTQTTVILAESRDGPAAPTATAAPPTRVPPTFLPRRTATLPPRLTLTSTPARTATSITSTPIPTRTATYTPIRPTSSPFPLPTATPSTRPAGGVSIERISTNLVYLGESTCGVREVTITARASAPAGIRVVVLFYRFQAPNSSTEFQSVGMNSLGSDLYERTLNPTDLLDGAVPFEQATLQYQIVIQQTNGDVSLRTPVMSDIVVEACGRVSPSACSTYTDERSCIANGCAWVNIPGVVPIFECRNP